MAITGTAASALAATGVSFIVAGTPLFAAAPIIGAGATIKVGHNWLKKTMY